MRRTSRAPRCAAAALAAAAILAGCSSPPPPPPADTSGASATFVRYAERDGEEIEIRGLRYRHVVVVDRGATGGVQRDESRRALSRDQLARVLAWAGRNDALTLRAPDGSQTLPTLAAPPPRTLEVQIGEVAIGIGWAEDSTWSDAAMATRVREAVAELRGIAEQLDRGALGRSAAAAAGPLRAEPERSGR